MSIGLVDWDQDVVDSVLAGVLDRVAGLVCEKFEPSAFPDVVVEILVKVRYLGMVEVVIVVVDKNGIVFEVCLQLVLIDFVDKPVFNSVVENYSATVPNHLKLVGNYLLSETVILVVHESFEVLLNHLIFKGDFDLLVFGQRYIVSFVSITQQSQ
ncbi:hypothetical protein Glove_272g3 [Diversispora epigaea]|uniref:Uncharacterized protein n=1 Tax=Diversispora epigaea TaxID=1348612 RepID=A0A397I5Y0_9GLOM|nr:hypothetical protein Glove_272g3 [Diversispora epigaea]